MTKLCFLGHGHQGASDPRRWPGSRALPGDLGEMPVPSRAACSSVPASLPAPWFHGVSWSDGVGDRTHLRASPFQRRIRHSRQHLQRSHGGQGARTEPGREEGPPRKQGAAGLGASVMFYRVSACPVIRGAKGESPCESGEVGSLYPEKWTSAQWRKAWTLSVSDVRNDLDGAQHAASRSVSMSNGVTLPGPS